MPRLYARSLPSKTVSEHRTSLHSVAIVFALLSALAYGISDFLGGIFSKKASPWQVAVVAQMSSTTFNALAALVIGG